MTTQQQLMSCFKMPSGLTITGRASSIKNAFVAAIVPAIRPTAEDISQVLSILGMEPTDVRCSYCGDSASEWDHFKPLVTDGKPTGYPSSIRNLVPSCGKCNQSKGMKPWKAWMTGSAPLSPSTRGVKDLEGRITRLEAFEQWVNCRPLDIKSEVDEKLWDQYYGLQSDILKKMREAQQLAITIRETVRKSAAEGREGAANIPQEQPQD